MSDSQSPLNLSSRGQVLAIPTDENLMWIVIRNLWDPETNPGGYVSLGLAENDLLHEKLVSYIEKNCRMPTRYLTYLDGGSGSRRLTAAIARFLNRHLKPVKPILRTHVIVTNGCSSAVENLVYSFTNPGDGILLGRPYYRSFLFDIELRPQAKAIKVAFGDVDPMSLQAVACYEDAIHKSKAENHPVKALLLCHPHNPLGRCYSRDVLIAYMKLCQKYQIHLISDEIYALSIWENTEDTDPAPVPFESIASIDTTGIIDPHLVHIVWGLSKDFGANGLRIGAVISQANDDLIAALQVIGIWAYPSNLTDHVSSVMLEDDAFTDAYIKENSEKLSQNFTMAVRYLRKHGIECLPGANAGFFIMVDLGAAYLKRHPETEGDISKIVMEKLMEKMVFLVDSEPLGSEKNGWFRIVFSQNERDLMEGLRRIVAAVEAEEIGAENKNEIDIPTRPKIGDEQLAVA